MRILTALLAVIVITACGGPPKINTGIYIPQPDPAAKTDTNYEEGWRLLQEGKTESAMEKFQQSGVSDEKMYVAFGYTLLAENKFLYARRNFRKALDINPENLQAELGIAAIHEILKENDKAFSIYARLFSRNPDNERVKARYRHIKSAQTQFYLNLAEEHKAAGRNRKYIQALVEASRYSPEMTEIKLQVADFYYQQEDYENAVIHYSKLLEDTPQDRVILKKLAQVYETMDKAESAILTYNTLLKLSPGDMEVINKINDLKVKLYESDLPPKFKNIFFKEQVTREDVAALLGFYFKNHLQAGRSPVIIRDISSSFAREYIIKICTLNIMRVRPDHSFDRFSRMNRATFAVVLDSLIKYLEKSGYSLNVTPPEEPVKPIDISPLHKHYKVIEYLVNARIMKLDDNNRFKSAGLLSPADVVNSFKRILYNIEIKRD